MPVVDQLAVEYSDRVSFVAVAWKSSLAATADQAARLMPSGHIKWGLDESQEVFSRYAVPYQPVTVLVSGNDIEVARWPGALAEDQIRREVENLIALGA